MVESTEQQNESQYTKDGSEIISQDTGSGTTNENDSDNVKNKEKFNGCGCLLLAVPLIIVILIEINNFRVSFSRGITFKSFFGCEPVRVSTGLTSFDHVIGYILAGIVVTYLIIGVLNGIGTVFNALIGCIEKLFSGLFDKRKDTENTQKEQEDIEILPMEKSDEKKG